MEEGAFEERSLVEAAKRNPEAFAALYDLYFDRVYAFGSRSRSTSRPWRRSTWGSKGG